LRVTMDELKKHNTKGDAWSAFNGKVYNMSEYARFHPGGEKEMMRVAGRDGTRLFSEHPSTRTAIHDRRYMIVD
jgi:cytochrome b involved in lipid metabolism